jgi:hypothetical protein
MQKSLPNALVYDLTANDSHKSPLAASFEEASAFLDRYFGRKRRFQPSTAAVGV